MSKFISKQSLLLLFSIAGFLLIVNTIPIDGAIYTHDSVAYSYAAKAFLNGGGFEYFGSNTPVIQWPPLYIVLLIIPTFLGIEIAKFVTILNGALFATLIFMVGKWLIEHLHNKVFAYIGLMLVLFSVPLIEVSRYIWTEILFINLVVASLMAIEKYINSRQTKWIVMAGVMSSMCWLTRYIGITVIVTSCFLLLWKIDFSASSEKAKQPNNYLNTLLAKVKAVFIYGFISSFLMAFWVLRNLIISGTFTGGRYYQRTSILHNIMVSLKIFFSWISVEMQKLGLTGIALLLILLIISLVIIIIYSKNSTHSDIPLENIPFENLTLGNNPLGSNPLGSNPHKKGIISFILSNKISIIHFIVFALIYSAVLVYAESTVAMDLLNNRLWSPIYIPMVLISIYFVDRIVIAVVKTKNNILATAIKYSFIIALTLVLIAPLKHTLLSMNTIHTSKQGIEYSYYTKSEIYKFAKSYSFSDKAIVFTNNPVDIEFNLKLDARYTPKKNGIALYGVDKFMRDVEDSSRAYLIWFGDTKSKSLYSVDDIMDIYELKLIEQSIDGVMYEIVK